MKTVGYSGTPLATKLGFNEGNTIWVANALPHYFDLFDQLPAASFVQKSTANVHVIHYFATQMKALTKDLPRLRKSIQPNGSIWVSWPKKASKVETDITEDTIRALALAQGLVDVKVCAIDNTWSGLKLVIPVKDRPKT